MGDRETAERLCREDHKAATNARCWSCVRITEALDAARADERAKVVAYLNSRPQGIGCGWLAWHIERGDHLTAEED